MNANELRRRYETVWKDLERQLSLARRKGGHGKKADIHTLAQLYLETAGHLSAARTYFPHDDTTVYLNGLVGQAHLLIYGRQQGSWRAIGGFFDRGFPSVLREARVFFRLSWLVTLLSTATGFAVVWTAPESLYWIFPSAFVQLFDPARAGPHKVVAPIMSTLIMTHNIQVAIVAFLGGLTLGLYTLYVLYQNGLILGALAAVFLRAGRSLMFWSLILPHGCIELTAINIAGAAGLMTGYRFLAPGRLGRWRSLQQAAALAAQLLAGVALMLIVAGTIEGFLTPSYAPIWVKYGFACLTVIGMVFYFSRGGRRGPRRDTGTMEVEA